MNYLKKINLMTEQDEHRFFRDFKLTCFDSFYPIGLFSGEKGLTEMHFSDITIFCGSNGSGKSTLLNIIAEKLQLPRTTPYNKTFFFEPYLEHCRFTLAPLDREQLYSMKQHSKIISSDEVFDHIIAVRHRNDHRSYKRQVIFEEKANYNRNGWTGERPSKIDFEDSQSVKAYVDYANKIKLSASQLVRRNVGYDERTYSNGENGFKYFTDAILPGGLYLLDEPENSLSAELQLQLADFLQGMARFYDCQFVISTHSPFLLSLPHARIYHLDACPVCECRWTDLPNVRIFHEFFRDHAAEFKE